MNQGLRQNGYAEVGDSAEVSADSALPQTLTPALSHPPVGERGTATLTPDPLELIAAGRHSIEAVCRESRMSILELATHVCTDQNIAALGRVAQLHAMEREILLGQLKRDALMRLRELTDEVPAASADEVRAAEVMRKACVDILRVDDGGLNTERRPSSPGGARSRGYHRESITPASEAEVLEALERLGEEKIEDEPRAQASGSVVPPSPGMPSDVSSDMSSEALKDVRSSFDSTAHNGPGARALGSYLPTPPEKITILTRTRRVPLEKHNKTLDLNSGGDDGARFEDGHPP